MSQQRTFASMAWAQKGKITRRERFLAEMDAVIPWARLLALIAPHYPTAGKGRQPLGAERMLRIYFLQHWFNLSDPGAEEALYDSRALRAFVGIDHQLRAAVLDHHRLQIGSLDAPVVGQRSSVLLVAQQRELVERLVGPGRQRVAAVIGQHDMAHTGLVFPGLEQR